jgi:mono/diheme cytochrome c family protein
VILNEAQKPNTPFFIIIAMLVMIGVAITAVLYSKRQEAKQTLMPWTGPANVTQLEIKGELPDGTASWNEIEVPSKTKPDEMTIATGKEVYAKACAGCHGDTGKGDGPLTKQFDLPTLPANLTKPISSVKIRTTMSGTPPLESDLFRTITRGLPDTPMWSYRGLGASERWALVHYIRSLSQDDSKIAPEVVMIPPKLQSSAKLLDTGKQIFLNVCANCHGPEAMGGAVPMQDSETGKGFAGTRFARDGGTQMLSGSGDEDMARTLMTGFHQLSPMRSFKAYFYLSESPTAAQKIEGDRKLWGSVLYARELINAQKK